MTDSTQIKVWDIAVRIFHWSLVTGFVIAYFAEGEWLDYHIVAGYIVFRFTFISTGVGFCWHPLRTVPKFCLLTYQVWRYLVAVLSLRAERYRGHNPAGGAMIIALIISVFITTTTGILLYGADAWLGPMAWLMKNSTEAGITAIDEIHAFSANFTVMLIGIHVLGVIWESVLHARIS